MASWGYSTALNKNIFTLAHRFVEIFFNLVPLVVESETPGLKGQDPEQKRCFVCVNQNNDRKCKKC